MINALKAGSLAVESGGGGCLVDHQLVSIFTYVLYNLSKSLIRSSDNPFDQTSSFLLSELRQLAALT